MSGVKIGVKCSRERSDGAPQGSIVLTRCSFMFLQNMEFNFTFVFIQFFRNFSLSLISLIPQNDSPQAVTVAASTQSVTTTTSRPIHSVAMERPSDVKESWGMVDYADNSPRKFGKKSFLPKAKCSSFLLFIFALHLLNYSISLFLRSIDCLLLRSSFQTSSIPLLCKFHELSSHLGICHC